MDTLFAELTVGLGLAMAGGNGWAMIQHRRGNRPEDAEGEYRPGRARFFVLVGTIMTIWGILTLVS